MLDETHTHLGIGVYALDDRLRYVEVNRGGVANRRRWVSYKFVGNTASSVLTGHLN